MRPDFSLPWQSFLRKQHNNYNEKWAWNEGLGFFFAEKNEMAIWFRSLTNGRFWQYKIWEDIFYQWHCDFSYGELLSTSKRQDLQSWNLKKKCNVKECLYHICHGLKVQGRRGEQSLNLHRMTLSALLFFGSLWLILDPTVTFC